MSGFEEDVSVSPSSPSAQAVKPDPAKQEINDNDDLYEDSFDLDTTNQHERLMLVRLPEYLMERLRKGEEELAGADLGKVLIPQGPGADPKKLRVLLNPQVELLKPLPHRYALNVVHNDVNNIYVMREQEAKRKRKAEELSSGTSREDEGEGAGPSSPQESDSASQFRRAKRTALIGHAVNECTLVADMSDPNYNFVLQQRKLMELPQAERQTTLLDSMAGVGGAKYGATLRQQKDAWRKPAQKRHALRASGDGRATRLERNALLDLLFKAFEEQPYWTVKQLRERTRQPEVYLRSTLDSIAVLIKRGPYAMKYGLREEYKHLQSLGATIDSMIEKTPAGPEFNDVEDPDGHDSDDMEMENVEIQ